MTTDIELGKRCEIASKAHQNNHHMHVVVYHDDIENIIKLRSSIVGGFLPPTLTTYSLITQTSLLPKGTTVRSANDKFVLIDKKIDEHGNWYYQCLYTDDYGWIIGQPSVYQITECKENLE